MDEIKFRQALGDFEQDVDLKKYTTIFLGGKARYFALANSLKKLIDAVSAARNFGVNYRILGFGSNILISDKGFDGLVIINRANTIQIDKAKGVVIAEGGAPLAKLILEAASNGLSGLEAMYGIPGTVAGAVCVNAGAHQTSISKFLKSATIMLSTDKIVSVQNEWFEFKYRSSKLKYNKEEFPPVVLSVTFQFQQKRTQEILDEVSKMKALREDHQPIGEKTCGSVFRNPSLTDKNDDSKEKTAGYLLEQSGAKKLRVGGMRVSKKHANWIVNDGHGTALEARKLIEQMRESVLKEFSISLEEEVEYLGDWS